MKGEERTREAPVGAALPCDDDSAEPLARLLRALGRGSRTDAYRAYRDLHMRGQKAIPVVSDYLRKQDWTRIEGKYALTVFSTLVSLIHDIDEVQSTELVQGDLLQRAHRYFRTRWESIHRFSVNDYRCVRIQATKIFVSKGLGDHDRKIGCLEKWLTNVPAQDLSAIERIYVIPKEPDPEYAGCYTPILYNITVVWYEFPEINGRLGRLLEWPMEWVLYHEIGHHVHRHTWGQDPDQEREADAYAMRLMSKAHPQLAILMRFIRFGRRIVPRGLRQRYGGT